ncbi:hypothetical protein OHB26_28195 [Nocardia sp. NBC_01503]|uniref:hypothetical protein n=1 Tax=Nocardia sp. NBC_01503 TaxID=2975997 RepID=UPI002E7AD98B|nr:hypothetical protein [Nocardia sp. NBC_01503]WTL30788.1 hypothetical protein OHB26_28195 [Nocardia sp. NBC_01503]
MSHHAGFRETTGTPTGESILDTVNGPGLALLFFGILVLGSTLTATGTGFDGWSLIGVLASVLCLVTGAAVVRIEHHRAREDHSISAGRNARRGTAG